MRFVFFTALLFAFCPNNGRVFSSVVPGYLDFDNLPDTNFSCDGKVIGGYYADVETGCQMFHVCTIGQKGEITDIKFLCLNGTVFDQETRVCERVDEVDCSKTEGFYDLNLELYGNNAALSYHETEEDPVTVPAVSSTPSSTTTTTTTTTTTAAPTTVAQLSLGRTPASTHYSSTPSPSVAAALLNVHSALSRDRHPHPHLTVQGGGSSGVLNPTDAFQSLKTSVEPQQFLFSSTTAKYSPLSVSVSTGPPPAGEPQLHVVHYQPAHHIFTTPSVAIVSSTRSVSSVKGVVGKLADGHSRVPINNFAFGINTGLNPAQYPAENATATGQQLPQLSAHDPYDEYHEADDVSLDSFFRDVPRIAKQSKQVQRQKRAAGRGRFRPSLAALREESGEEEPSPQGSEVFPQEVDAPQLDAYFQKRPRVRARPEESRSRSEPSPTPAAPQLDTYFQKRPKARARPEEPRRRSDDGPAAEASELSPQEAVTPQPDAYFQRRPRVRARPEEPRRRSGKGLDPEGSDVLPQEVAAPRAVQRSRVRARPEVSRRRFEEGPGPEASRAFPQEAPAPRADPYSRKQSRRRPEAGQVPEASDALPREAAAPYSQQRSRARARPEEPSRPEEDAPPSAEAFFRSTRIGQLQQTVTPVPETPAYTAPLATEEPVDVQTIQTTTLAAETTSRYRAVTQQLPYGRGNEVEGPSGRRPAGGEGGGGRRPAAGGRGSTTTSRRGGSDGQRADYQAVLAEVSRGRPPQAAEGSTSAPLDADPRRPAGQRSATQRRGPSRRPPPPADPQASYERAAAPTTPQPPTTLPATSFSCADKIPGGYYADVEADCQLFHICSQGRHGRITDNKFMCGPGTRFNQQSRTCQARELVDCSISTSLYHLNNHFQLGQQEDLNDEPGFEILKVGRSKRQAKGAARIPDYTIDSLPETSFSCEDKPSEGLYADVETQCQGFHLCQKVKGVMTLVSTFVCPHKTVFNQHEGNCDSWEDVDCSLYSQPEHTFDRKGNRKHTHTKRDTSHILKPLYLFTQPDGESDNLKKNISSKHHRLNSRNEKNTKNTSPFFRYNKSLKKSNSGNEFVQSNGSKGMKLDLMLDLQPTTPLSHKRIKHEVTDESNETEEEYYDYIDDSYEADLVPPEQENSNVTSDKDTSDSTQSHSDKESSDIVTTHLANISLNELLIANNNENDTSTEGAITTLSSISSSSNTPETGVKDCAGNETCDHKDELRHTGNEKGTVTSSDNMDNTEAPLHSTTEQLTHSDSKNNKTSAPHNDEYEYYDYYIEDEADEIINYPTEQTTLSGLVRDGEPSPDVNISIPKILPTSSEKSYSSTTESMASYTVTADTSTNESDTQNKYNSFPAIVSAEDLENAQNKHFESSSQKSTGEDDGENNEDNNSEEIPVSQTPEISLEDPISAVDEKYDYYDSASNDDGAQFDVTHKEVPNMNFATTERSQNNVSHTNEESAMNQHSTEGTNETSFYGAVTDVSVTQVSGNKPLKLPEVADVHEERTDHSTTLPTLLDRAHDMDMDLLSEPNVSMESGLPMVVNTTLHNQNTGDLVSENASQINSSLSQYTTIHQKEADENNNQFQIPLQSDRKETKINSLSENTTPLTTTQSSSTLPIPNLFHPPKPHRAYHGRHSTPLLPPVVIRSKDATQKSRIRNNRHKTKKTQNDEIHTTTETFVKSENGPVISASDSYFLTNKELISKKDEVTSVDSAKDTRNTLAISGRVNELKVEQKTEPVFQQDTVTHSEEFITAVPSTEMVFGQTVSENDLRVKTDGSDSCKGNTDCQHVQSEYTTLSPVNYKFHDKHTDHLSHRPQNDGLLSEHTEKTVHQPNSLEQSTSRTFKGSEERSKADEPVLGTDIPPTSSGNTVDYVTITPKVQSLKDASYTATTDSLFPTFTLSAINAQTNQKSNQDISRFVCSGKELYRYYPDPLDCRIFHYCSHGFHNQQVLDFRFMCDNGTAFSTDTQKCENEELVQSCSMTKK